MPVQWGETGGGQGVTAYLLGTQYTSQGRGQLPAENLSGPAIFSPTTSICPSVLKTLNLVGTEWGHNA